MVYLYNEPMNTLLHVSNIKIEQ